MGHFFPPPPPQIVAANATQPFAPPKAPPSTLVVPNPPFAHEGTYPNATPNVIVSAWQPDPWIHVYLSRTGRGSPFRPDYKIPPPPPTPPFAHEGTYPNATPTVIVGMWQPDPWSYGLQARNSGQPYAQGKLSPGIPGQSVDNPPPVYEGRYPNATPDVIVRAWQPDWPYVFFDTTTGAQPYAGPTPTPPPTVVVVVTQGPYANLWMASVIQSWFVPDPPPTVSRTVFTPGIRVDNPPFQFRPPVPAYPSGYVLLSGIAGIPQSGAAPGVVQTPYSNVWMANVIQSWFAPDLPPTLPRTAFTPGIPVNNPPFPGSASPLPNILAGWQPPDPTPSTQGKLSPGIPGQSVDNPPFARPPLIPYPPPDVPFQQQPSVFPPATVVVTVQGPYNNTWLASIVQSWFGPDPQPTLPRNLNPFFTAVPVNNPPFSHYSRSAWVAEIAVLAWQPPDPLPTLSNKLNPTVLAVPVNNPPFGSRTELPGILAQWAPWPPSQFPTPYIAPPQVQPGPPPPPITAQFTVSGPDVSVYLQEFFYDVSYSDAPVTKRTV